MGNEQRRIVAADPGQDHPIQRAIDALGGPGLVHLPEGEYTVETTTVIPSGVSIVGDGIERTIVTLAPGSNCHIFTNSQHQAGNDGIQLRDFTIVGKMRSQEKPAGLAAVSWGCAGYFKGVQGMILQDLALSRIRQSAFHLNHSTDVEIRRVTVDQVGWSGLSTSKADDLRVHDMVITNSGLDVRHSGIHLDGGQGAFLDVVVDGSTGNGIMLDSKFAALSDVAVHGVARRCLRGMSLSGDHDHDLSHVWVTGDFSHNREIGLMVSNSSHVFITGATFGSNGRSGVVIQGAGQSRHCVVVDCTITGSKRAIEERDGNRLAYLANTIAIPADVPARLLGTKAPPSPTSLRALPRRVRGRVARAARARAQEPVASAPPVAVARPVAPSGAAAPGAPSAPVVPESDAFEGTCNVCGAVGVFVRNNASLREGYRCAKCQASLRYRGQADALLRTYGRGEASLAELVRQPEFAALSLWEPGVLGAFRPYFTTMPGYVMSDFWPDVAPGDQRDGVRCEDLMALTFAEASFDLVVSSDIFEHVRRPFVGFAELHRVLRPGGRHIFSIPVQLPWRSVTVARIDVSGDEDVHLLEPRYHLGPNNSRHIVYNDFGRDLVEGLEQVGFDTEVIQFSSPSAEASRLLTFCSTKR